MILVQFISTAVIDVEFKSSSYSINEQNKLVFMLALSNPSSTAITLKVNTNDVTATGMCSLVVLQVTTLWYNRR